MNCAMGASDTDLLDGIVGPREQRDSGAARGQGGTAELAAGPRPGSSQRPRAHARTKGRSQAQSPGPPSEGSGQGGGGAESSAHPAAPPVPSRERPERSPRPARDRSRGAAILGRSRRGAAILGRSRFLPSLRWAGMERDDSEVFSNRNGSTIPYPSSCGGWQKRTLVFHCSVQQGW